LVTTGGVLEIEDTDHWGVFGVDGFKFNDMISIEAGWGTRTAEQDNPTNGFTNKDEKSAFVLFVPISISPAFIITPEFYYADQGDITINGVTQDRGNQMRYGIYWRIDF